MKKILFAFNSFILITFVSSTLSAYRLPPCSVSNDERQKASEDVVSTYRAELDELARTVNISRLNESKENPKIRLTKKEHAAAKRYSDLLVKIEFWNEVIRLKGSLLALHGRTAPPDTATEADAIAKDVIETLYTLSQKWKIGSSALFTNFLINTGLKEKGFCYHYVANLRKPLLKLSLNQFDIRWGTAWENTYRENNALVITAKGKPFEDGLAVDSWRTAGRPFWTPVKGDRFPWVEIQNVEVRYDVE